MLGGDISVFPVVPPGPAVVSSPLHPANRTKDKMNRRKYKAFFMTQFLVWQLGSVKGDMRIASYET